MEFTIYIVVVPLLMFLLLALGGNKISPRSAGILGTLGMTMSTILSYLAAYRYYFEIGKSDDIYQKLIPFNIEWLRFTEKLQIDLGILLDPTSIMMLIVITTVSLMVHIYSTGYMSGEKGYQRYFAFLSLFSFSMMGLVIATNIFQMYIFWELVGVSSYLLIGFFYTKPEAVAAAKKAFIITRFADLGFLIGILLLSYYTGSFNFELITANKASLVVNSMAGVSFLGLSAATWAMFLIFMGGAGKSAMFPFHIWLPDAMEGPTPVSALIHAATMVVAGVFLVARLFNVYLFAAPDVLTLIGYIGALTALFAALIAITQTDIKRVLAFSTISQIAYMMLALSVSGYGGYDGLGYTSSMFHLFTHAFFKALLFLGAGSIIHAIHSNEMTEMGGLRKYMKVTHITFLIGCLAISGIPLFSGFFSKDEILVAVFHHDKLLYTIALLVAGLTAFYMFRLYFKIFWGKEKMYEFSPHESSPNMQIPLLILAIFSCTTGFIPFSKFIGSDNIPFSVETNYGIALSSVAIAMSGIIGAMILYKNGSEQPALIASQMRGFYKMVSHKFHIDEIWMFFVKKIIFRYIAAPTAWFDKNGIDRFIDGIGFGTKKTSWTIRELQSGKVQLYGWIFIISTLILSLLVLYFQ